MGVVWHGVKEFDAALEGLATRSAVAGRAASTVAGAELVSIAAGLAPRGATGELASSVTQRSVGARVLVGPTVDYGRRIELGFKGRKSVRGKRKRLAAGIDTGRRGLQPTKPNPFLLRALEASRERIFETYKSAWGKSLRRSL